MPLAEHAGQVAGRRDAGAGGPVREHAGGDGPAAGVPGRDLGGQGCGCGVRAELELRALDSGLAHCHHDGERVAEHAAEPEPGLVALGGGQRLAVAGVDPGEARQEPACQPQLEVLEPGTLRDGEAGPDSDRPGLQRPVQQRGVFRLGLVAEPERDVPACRVGQGEPPQRSLPDAPHHDEAA